MNTIYKDVKKYLPTMEGKRFKVEQFILSEERVKRERMFAAFGGGMSYREVYSLKPGKYVKLIDKELHQIVMSDTPMELETNERFVREARGRVLVGGLGLGIVILAIQAKEEVKEIVVVEKYEEVVALIKERLPLNSKVKVVLGDIKEYPVEKGFDTIYFDIWNTISADNWTDMKSLHRRWRRSLNQGGWMGSWRQSDCQRSARNDKQSWR